MNSTCRTSRRALRTAFASLILCAAAISATPDASAQQQPSAKALAEARQRYDKGKQLYSEGAFDAALAELQRSYELAPSYKLLYNIALVQRARNDFAGSLAAYEKYATDGGKDLTSARKAEVQKEIDTLRTLVAKAEIKISVEGAEVTIDDAPVGKSPIVGSVILNPGSHRVGASKEGRQSAVKVIKVAGGDAVTVQLDLPETTSAQPTTTATVPVPTATETATSTAPLPTVTDSGSGAPPPPPPPPQRGPVWVGWVITGALAVGAGVTGGLAMAKAGEHSDLRGKSDTTAADLEATRSSAKTFALVTDILVPAAVVAGVVSLYFSVRTPPPAKTGKGPHLQLGAAPTVGPSGVSGAAGSITGTF
ncbi:MAG: PEGA domain-containing protein [Polyangiaceae bacterium]